MKLGIDFGTTRVVVSAADRGNYPLVPFETADGRSTGSPSLVAIHGNERRYGWDAYAMQASPGGSSSGRSSAISKTLVRRRNSMRGGTPDSAGRSS